MADAAALPVASPAESAAAGGALPAAPPAAPRGVLTPAAAAADAPPPPLPPPPGFEAADAGSHKVEPELAADVAAITAAVTAAKVAGMCPCAAAHLRRALTRSRAAQNLATTWTSPTCRSRRAS